MGLQFQLLSMTARF